MFKSLAADRASHSSLAYKSRLAAEVPGRWRVLGFILLVILGAASRATFAQANDWAWMGGSDTLVCSQPHAGCVAVGSYGTLGVRSATNAPGSHYGSVTWTDSAGNFWLFGGGPDGLNDLWKYDPSALRWTWMSGSNGVGYDGVYGTQGVAAAGNVPGARSFASGWTDKNGDLWLFGGTGYDVNGNFGALNDLWKYSPYTNQWTWMKGGNTVAQTAIYGSLGTPASQNTPGARYSAASWTDKNDDFWLFGGEGDDDLNDLWRYSVSTNEWTWMAGSSISFQAGTYGTMGVPAAGNTPGARYYSSAWTDKTGNFWLFGGTGLGNGKTSYGALNELWSFNPSTRLWTWVNGSDVADQPGVYGTLGTPSPATVPGSRDGGLTWTDGSGNLWLFGGYGSDAAGVDAQLNDLMEYSPSTNQWTWMGGPSLSGCAAGNQGCGKVGVYGTFATPSAEDTPGGRWLGASWTDTSGNFWLFGGLGIDAVGNSGYLNDLWKYQTSSVTLPAASAPVFSIAPGTYTSAQTLTLTDATPGVTIYYTALPSTNWTAYTGPITVSSTGTIEAVAAASGYSTSAVSSAAYQFQLPSTTALSVSSYPYVTGNPITFTAQVSGTVAGAPVPTGTLQFNINGVALGSPVTLDATGTATHSSTSLPVGYLSITAAYTPSIGGSFAASTSNVVTETVSSSPRQSDGVLFANSVRTLGSGFNQPFGVAIDSGGDVFVADRGSFSVKVILASSGYSTVHTPSNQGIDAAGVAVDGNSNLFVADTFHNTVLEFLSNSGYSQTVDLGRGFQSPIGVAVDANNNLYVADSGHGQVKFMPLCPDCGGGYGDATILSSNFQYPWGIAVDANKNVFVTDIGNATVNELTAASNYTTQNAVGNGLFLDPYGLAVDTNGNVFVTDFGYGTVREVSELDGFTTVSSVGSGLNIPVGAAVDTLGNLFIADTRNNAVKEISQTGGNFSQTQVGSQSQVISMVFRFNAATTLGSTAVLAQQGGPASGVFADAGTGSCKAAATYAANATCSVDVLFTPTQTGAFTGVVELLDGSGKVLALGSVQGIGFN
jgi:hypothetical protein